jgi:hypothetical protein
MKLSNLLPHGSSIAERASLIPVLCLLTAPQAFAESVDLAWDPSPDAGVASYRVHYGTGSASYTVITNAGPTTGLTVQGLAEGTTYFFAVTAVGTNQLESDFSNEVSYTVPAAQNTAPSITSVGSQTINEDEVTAAIGLTVADDETAAGGLTVTGTSGNTDLVPNAGITIGGSGADRSVTVTPAANEFGTALITVQVSDGELSASQQFTLTVNSVNDSPTLAAIGNLSVVQDAGQQTLSLGGISSGAPNEDQVLTVSAISSNPTLVPTPVVDYASPSSSATLRFTPASGQTGSAQITVTVDDGGGTANGGVESFQRSFAVNVSVAPNAEPTLDNISDMTVVQAEGEPGLSLGAMGAGGTIWSIAAGGAPQPQTVNLTGIGTGGESSQALTVTASSSNPSLIPTPTIVYASPSSTGTLNFTPTVGSTGSSIITVTVKDDGGGLDTVEEPFTVNVTGPANTAPVLATIGNQTLNEDGDLGPVGFSVSDGQTSAGDLVVTATSGNPTLLDGSSLQLGGTSGSRNLRVTPVANQSGKALVTLKVTDAGGAMAHKAFWVKVNPVNDAPTLNSLANMTLADGAIETISLAGIGVGPLDGVQAMTVQATSSNPSIVPNPEVVYYSPDDTAELQLEPLPGAGGTATITVRVNDDGGTANGGQDTVTRTFTVTTAPQVVSGSSGGQTVVSSSAASLAVARPSLEIATEGGKVLLTWDGSVGTYSVERSPAMGPGSIWTDVDVQPESAGGSMVRVSLEPQNPVEFFRLVRQ